MFWILNSVDGIKYVWQHELAPEYPYQPPLDYTNNIPVKPEGLSPEDSDMFDEYWNNYDYAETLLEYNNDKSLFENSLTHIDSDYNEIWDECKRCPADKDNVLRYEYIYGSIMPKANVNNIVFNEGQFTIDDNGVLRWK